MIFQLLKFPKINIVNVIKKSGKKEEKNKTITIRKLGSEKQETLKASKLIKNMLSLNKLPLN